MYSKFKEKTVQIHDNTSIMILYCEYLKKTFGHDLLSKMQMFLTPVKNHQSNFKNSEQLLLFMTMQWS